MIAPVVALSALSLVLLLAVIVQRRALVSLRRVVGAYKVELHKAHELMAVMAREDVAVKSRSEREAQRRGLGT